MPRIRVKCHDCGKSWLMNTNRIKGVATPDCPSCGSRFHGVHKEMSSYYCVRCKHLHTKGRIYMAHYGFAKR
jgi:DNA-directed RNA polymerase subunit RPC12/RpoP